MRKSKTPLILCYSYKNGVEQVFRSRKDAVILGRSIDKPIHVDLSPDIKVSRQHARLFYNLSTWWVEDLDSRYGTKLNGKLVTEAVSLSAGDQIQLGDTVIYIDFVTHESNPSPGSVENRLIIDEIQPPAAISEDKCLEVLASIASIAAHSHGQAMLEGFLYVLGIAFPQAERRTIVLIEDKELVPRVFWPPDQSHISFTLARQTIIKQEALHWVRRTTTSDTNSSLYDTATALYAPLLCKGRVIGVVHIDTTSPGVDFNPSDLQLLSVIANTIGPAIKASGSDGIDRFPSVFISYAPEDRTFINRLATNLRRRRVKVWLDERLRSGVAWREQLAAAIRATDAFVLVMSPQSIASDQVQWEIDVALSTHNRVFLLSYVNCYVPDQLASLQIIEIGTNFEAGALKLVNELYDIFDQPPDWRNKGKTPVRILFLAANPLNTDSLRLSEEVRTIDERLRLTKFRDRFELLSHWALRPSDLVEYLLRYNPHIVHFSGHGSIAGEIILEDVNGFANPVSDEAISRLFRVLKDNLYCVVLNTCWSATQAQAIAQEIDCVLGMSQAISDQAAIAFAGGFYSALGYGRNIQTAFDLGCAEIGLADLVEEAIPRLLVKPGVNAARITFI